MINAIRALGSRTRARLATEEGGFTLAEVLVTIIVMSTIIGAITTAFMVGAKTSTAANERLQESQDAQLTSAYFVADASNASYFSQTTPPAGSACQDEGGNNVALFEWTEATVKKEAFYVKVGTPAELVRRYCENDVLQSSVTLVQNLGATGPTVTCPPVGSCTTTPTAVELKVVESSGYEYTLRASPRPKTATSGMGGIAIYVGGALRLSGNSVFDVPTGVVQVGGDATCEGVNSDVDAPDGFHSSTGSGTCAPPPGSALPDPLIDVPPITTAPGAASLTPTTTTACDTSQATYQPGSYNNPANGNKPVKLENACLASGVYYLDDPDGSILKNVTSADGGVLIYVAQAGLELDGANTLSPMTTGDQAGITVFLGRGNTGDVDISSTMTVYGLMYGPDGRLHMQSNNAVLSTGGVNFQEVLVQGNSSGLVLV